jgi:hypothetical protein
MNQILISASPAQFPLSPNEFQRVELGLGGSPLAHTIGGKVSPLVASSAGNDEQQPPRVSAPVSEALESASLRPLFLAGWHCVCVCSDKRGKTKTTQRRINVFMAQCFIARGFLWSITDSRAEIGPKFGVCGNWKRGEHKFWRLSCQMADSIPQKVYRLRPTARSQALDSEKMFDLSQLISDKQNNGFLSDSNYQLIEAARIRRE